ncbi:MAG: hypothetical protein SH868_00905 [Bythopirellula sp.]|nr:hypothetical protein [Bythopirellula sp.]
MSDQLIGLVDNQLDNFHAKVYLAAVRGPLAPRGYKIVGATALDAAPSRNWALDNGLNYFDSVAKLADHVDYFMVLAPANPEMHLEMCEVVLPFGKPTFVDKTFAPDFATARKIFELADSFAVPIQTTSALRSSTVQEELAKLDTPLKSMFITSSGPTFAEYGIHPVELAVSCLGPDVSAVMRMGPKEHPQVILKFSEGRTAIIDFNSRAEVPFTATLVSESSSISVEVAGDRLFVDAAASILDFFDAGEAQIDRGESLVIRQILDLLGNNLVENEFHSLATPENERHHLKAPHWKQLKGKSLTQ